MPPNLKSQFVTSSLEPLAAQVENIRKHSMFTAALVNDSFRHAFRAFRGMPLSSGHRSVTMELWLRNIRDTALPIRNDRVCLMREVIMYPGEDGFWVAECPSLPGCVSQGGTREAAITNVKEAIEGYVLALREDGLPVPEERFEAMVVAV